MLVHHGSQQVLVNTAAAGGAGPLCHDPQQARRAADLYVYLAQHHDVKDANILGRMACDGVAVELVVDDLHPGTDEQTWLGGNRLGGLRPFAATSGPRRLIVVAPHPDDEVLGAGGLLQQMQQAGVETVLVAVTDGEASHPGARASGSRSGGDTHRREAGCPSSAGLWIRACGASLPSRRGGG